MITFSYKTIIIDDEAKAALANALPFLGWAKGQERGFSIGTLNPREIRAAYVYRVHELIEEYDEDTLELKPPERQRSVQRRMVARFAIDFGRALMRVRKGKDFKVIAEALDDLPGVRFALRDLNVNLQLLHAAFAKQFRKNMLDGVALSDLLHADALLGNASMALIDPGSRERVVREYGSQLNALKFTVRGGGDSAFMVKIARNGTVQVGDEGAEDPAVLRTLEDMVLAFHEAEEHTQADVPIADVPEPITAEKSPPTKKSKKATTDAHG